RFSRTKCQTTAGLIHFMFNAFGSILFFILLICLPSFMDITFREWFSSAATQIAMFHTFFNVTCTLLFLPFTNIFVKASELLIKEKKSDLPATYLDERMLSSASLAIAQLEREMLLLSDIAMQAFRTAYQSFKMKDKSMIAPAKEQIRHANSTYHSIINYLIRLSAQSSLPEERSISNLHNNVGDIMRIAEIADNFTKYTQKSIDENLCFSLDGEREIHAMVMRIEDLYLLTRQIITEKESGLLTQIDQVENDIDSFRKNLIDNHIARLNQGKCKPESSGVFINLVSNLERLGDHLTYIAYTVN
ncbi:MAG: Na/Pi cotransporter family protein, partial [Lachnospiraceae bacterium]|nr:Na/Pi cotransporter family protein [Lachnospiraceae bacterium]